MPSKQGRGHDHDAFEENRMGFVFADLQRKVINMWIKKSNSAIKKLQEESCKKRAKHERSAYVRTYVHKAAPVEAG